MKPLKDFTDDVKREFVELPRERSLARSDADALAQRFNRALTEAMAKADATSVYLILDKLLDEKETSPVVFRQVVQMWGGPQAFTGRVEAFLARFGDQRSDIVGILSGKGTIAMRIARRLNDDRPADNGFDPLELSALAGKAVPHLLLAPLALAAGPLAGPVLVGGEIYLLKPHIDQVLQTAKGFWEELANDLVDSDLPPGISVPLAVAIQSLNDIFIPGSTLEAMLSVLPVGRLGVLIKAVLLKAAGIVGLRLAASGLKEIARALLRFFRTLIDTQVSSKMFNFENDLAVRLTTAASTSERNLVVREALAFLNIANQLFSFEAMIDDVAKAAKRVKNPLSQARMSQIRRMLQSRFSVPHGSPATVSFNVLPDGQVVQIVRTTLSRNPVGRTETDLTAIALKEALVAEPGQNWSHIAANRLAGDDALYNLVRAEARVNTSMMKVFDTLRPGTTIEVKLLFESAEMAGARYAKRVEYFNDKGEILGALPDLITRPGMTLAQVKRLAREYAQKVASLGSGNASNVLVQRLAEYFSLDSLK